MDSINRFSASTVSGVVDLGSLVNLDNIIPHFSKGIRPAFEVSTAYFELAKNADPYLQHGLVKKMLMFGCAVAATGFSYIAWKKYGKGIVESLFPRKDRDGKMDNVDGEIEGREKRAGKERWIGDRVDGSDVDGNDNVGNHGDETESDDDESNDSHDNSDESGEDDSDGESYYVEDSGAGGDCRVDSDTDSDDGEYSRYTVVLNNFGMGDASEVYYYVDPPAYL